MVLSPGPMPVPLTPGEDGVLRVAGTRVTLDSIAAAFDTGATAEEIAQQYPSVGLATIYTVLSYMLGNRDEVEAYLVERAKRSAQVREDVERRSDPTGIRARLEARRARG